MPKSPTHILRTGSAYLADLVDGQAVYGYPGGDYLGRQYYVNNVTGSSGGDGSDWENAMDEVSTAITAWEAYRASSVFVTNNTMVRGQIFIQATATEYTALTALPLYCDVIGLGADPRGNGDGLVQIGAATGTGDGVDVSSTVRGTNFYNIQFQAGQNSYSFRGTNFFRCRWENCVFATNGSPVGRPAAGFSAAICSGNVWKDCHWITASSIGTDALVGFQITGSHFHNCLVENCHIAGSTAGVEIAGACINGFGSIFRECYIGWGSSTCAIGVDDNATAGHIIFAGCYVFATDSFDMVNNGAGRIIGCTAANAFET